MEERLSCPESDSDSDSELEELELLELLEESELESDAWPELYKKGDRYLLGKIIKHINGSQKRLLECSLNESCLQQAIDSNSKKSF